jgi:hypothetical protein
MKENNTQAYRSIVFFHVPIKIVKKIVILSNSKTEVYNRVKVLN